MIYKKFLLKDLSDEFKNSNAFFEFYELDYTKEFGVRNCPRPGLLIIPGGAYKFVSLREGEPIALRMLTEGFNCFVLTYTVNEKYPTPQKEVAFTMNYINEHRSEFDLLNINLSLIGFSAGGHLVASIGEYYPELADFLHINKENIKPYAVILGYPVITSDHKYYNKETIDTIAGEDKELLEKMSLEKHVTSDFPPTYLFSTYDDNDVPIKNSELFIEALKKNKVPFKAHIFDSGYHGGSLFTRAVYYQYDDKNLKAEPNSVWVKEACEFIFKLVYKITD